jgi:hypothetical protein
MRDYTADEIRAASEGYHSGWSTFDIQNEGVRMHVLDGIVSAARFDADAAEEIVGELVSFAQSFGYADADSFLHRANIVSEDDEEANQILEIERQQLFDDYEENDFFAEYGTSLKRLGDVAATPEAIEFLGSPARWGKIYRAVVEAYERGRDMKVAQVNEAEPAAPSMR